jgi:hypothetical protein
VAHVEQELFTLSEHLSEKLKTNSVGTVPKSNRKTVERNKIDTTNSQITLTIIA